MPRRSDLPAGSLAGVQLADRDGEVGELGGVDLGRPTGGDRELEVGRDRVVVGVEQVLQIPPAHTNRAHRDAPSSDDRAPTGTGPGGPVTDANPSAPAWCAAPKPPP